MTTTCNRRTLRRLEVEPAASNSSVLGRTVPVLVTPTTLSAHSQKVINDFLENVKEILDKWKVSSGKQNDLMEWLKMNNQNIERGWLQNAAFNEKGIPGTAQKRMWLFCLSLLISGLYRGDGSPAIELGKAYGIGEETVRRNNAKVFADIAAEIQQVRSSNKAKLGLQEELQQAFRAYERWTPKRSKKKGEQETPNPVYTFLVEHRNEMGDKFRGCIRHLLLGSKDPPFAPKERLLLFSLRAALNGIDEPFAMDLLGEALGFDNNYLLQDFGYEVMSPLLFSPPVESIIVETSVNKNLLPLVSPTYSEANDKSANDVLSFFDAAPTLPLVSPAYSNDNSEANDNSEGDASFVDAARIIKEKIVEAPKQGGGLEFTFNGFSSGLEERKAAATIQSFSDVTNE
jgi:hypothetical protein